ncbi:hypothetical protein TRFO_26700 [Tritrichomonas foetus]|uniref:Uncharacterized protein n=1 Tax=Tritrichomonas foetus TaxID=1144522 RepID=A0A1J4K711_9EUKA|nr:hypothetical protein TRFO_26700 [Tritrichomonas foetus]|eukprot:OHT05510.1 hypothetical protein TRFO_26700 [Tritrichomonas foetus]
MISFSQMLFPFFVILLKLNTTRLHYESFKNIVIQHHSVKTIKEEEKICTCYGFSSIEACQKQFLKITGSDGDVEDYPMVLSSIEKIQEDYEKSTNIFAPILSDSIKEISFEIKNERIPHLLLLGYDNPTVKIKSTFSQLQFLQDFVDIGCNILFDVPENANYSIQGFQAEYFYRVFKLDSVKPMTLHLQSRSLSLSSLTGRIKYIFPPNNRMNYIFPETITDMVIGKNSVKFLANKEVFYDFPYESQTNLVFSKVDNESISQVITVSMDPNIKELGYVEDYPYFDITSTKIYCKGKWPTHDLKKPISKGLLVLSQNCEVYLTQSAPISSGKVYLDGTQFDFEFSFTGTLYTINTENTVNVNIYLSNEYQECRPFSTLLNITYYIPFWTHFLNIHTYMANSKFSNTTLIYENDSENLVTVNVGIIPEKSDFYYDISDMIEMSYKILYMPKNFYVKTYGNYFSEVFFKSVVTTTELKGNFSILVIRVFRPDIVYLPDIICIDSDDYVCSKGVAYHIKGKDFPNYYKFFQSTNREIMIYIDSKEIIDFSEFPNSLINFYFYGNEMHVKGSIPGSNLRFYVSNIYLEDDTIIASSQFSIDSNSKLIGIKNLKISENSVYHLSFPLNNPSIIDQCQNIEISDYDISRIEIRFNTDGLELLVVMKTSKQYSVKLSNQNLFCSRVGDIAFHCPESVKSLKCGSIVLQDGHNISFTGKWNGKSISPYLLSQFGGTIVQPENGIIPYFISQDMPTITGKTQEFRTIYISSISNPDNNQYTLNDFYEIVKDPNFTFTALVNNVPNISIDFTQNEDTLYNRIFHYSGDLPIIVPLNPKAFYYIKTEKITYKDTTLYSTDHVDIRIPPFVETSSFDSKAYVKCHVYLDDISDLKKYEGCNEIIFTNIQPFLPLSCISEDIHQNLKVNSLKLLTMSKTEIPIINIADDFIDISLKDRKKFIFPLLDELIIGSNCDYVQLISSGNHRFTKITFTYLSSQSDDSQVLLSGDLRNCIIKARRIVTSIDVPYIDALGYTPEIVSAQNNEKISIGILNYEIDTSMTIYPNIEINIYNYILPTSNINLIPFKYIFNGESIGQVRSKYPVLFDWDSIIDQESTSIWTLYLHPQFSSRVVTESEIMNLRNNSPYILWDIPNFNDNNQLKISYGSSETYGFKNDDSILGIQFDESGVKLSFIKEIQEFKACIGVQSCPSEYEHHYSSINEMLNSIENTTIFKIYLTKSDSIDSNLMKKKYFEIHSSSIDNKLNITGLNSNDVIGLNISNISINFENQLECNFYCRQSIISTSISNTLAFFDLDIDLATINSSSVELFGYSVSIHSLGNTTLKYGTISGIVSFLINNEEHVIHCQDLTLYDSEEDVDKEFQIECSGDSSIDIDITLSHVSKLHFDCNQGSNSISNIKMNWNKESLIVLFSNSILSEQNINLYLNILKSVIFQIEEVQKEGGEAATWELKEDSMTINIYQLKLEGSIMLASEKMIVIINDYQSEVDTPFKFGISSKGSSKVIIPAIRNINNIELVNQQAETISNMPFDLIEIIHILTTISEESSKVISLTYTSEFDNHGFREDHHIFSLETTSNSINIHLKEINTLPMTVCFSNPENHECPQGYLLDSNFDDEQFQYLSGISKLETLNIKMNKQNAVIKITKNIVNLNILGEGIVSELSVSSTTITKIELSQISATISKLPDIILFVLHDSFFSLQDSISSQLKIVCDYESFTQLRTTIRYEELTINPTKEIADILITSSGIQFRNNNNIGNGPIINTNTLKLHLLNPSLNFAIDAEYSVNLEMTIYQDTTISLFGEWYQTQNSKYDLYCNENNIKITGESYSSPFIYHNFAEIISDLKERPTRKICVGTKEECKTIEISQESDISSTGDLTSIIGDDKNIEVLFFNKVDLNFDMSNEIQTLILVGQKSENQNIEVQLLNFNLARLFSLKLKSVITKLPNVEEIPEIHWKSLSMTSSGLKYESNYKIYIDDIDSDIDSLLNSNNIYLNQQINLVEPPTASSEEEKKVYYLNINSEYVSFTSGPLLYIFDKQTESMKGTKNINLNISSIAFTLVSEPAARLIFNIDSPNVKVETQLITDNLGENENGNMKFIMKSSKNNPESNSLKIQLSISTNDNETPQNKEYFIPINFEFSDSSEVSLGTKITKLPYLRYKGKNNVLKSKETEIIIKQLRFEKESTLNILSNTKLILPELEINSENNIFPIQIDITSKYMNAIVVEDTKEIKATTLVFTYSKSQELINDNEDLCSQPWEILKTFGIHHINTFEYPNVDIHGFRKELHLFTVIKTERNLIMKSQYRSNKELPMKICVGKKCIKDEIDDYQYYYNQEEFQPNIIPHNIEKLAIDVNKDITISELSIQSTFILSGENNQINMKLTLNSIIIDISNVILSNYVSFKECSIKLSHVSYAKDISIDYESSVVESDYISSRIVSHSEVRKLKIHNFVSEFTLTDLIPNTVMKSREYDLILTGSIVRIILTLSQNVNQKSLDSISTTITLNNEGSISFEGGWSQIPSEYPLQINANNNYITLKGIKSIPSFISGSTYVKIYDGKPKPPTNNGIIAGVVNEEGAIEREEINLQGQTTLNGVDIDTMEEKEIKIENVSIASGSTITAKKLTIDSTLSMSGSSVLKASENDQIKFEKESEIVFSEDQGQLPKLDLGKSSSHAQIPKSIIIKLDFENQKEEDIISDFQKGKEIISGYNWNCEEWKTISTFTKPDDISIDFSYSCVVGSEPAKPTQQKIQTKLITTNQKENIFSSKKIVNDLLEDQYISLVLMVMNDSDITIFNSEGETSGENEPQDSEEPSNTGMIVGIVIGVIAVIVIVVVVVIVVLKRKQNAEKSSVSSNSSSVSDKTESQSEL